MHVPHVVACVHSHAPCSESGSTPIHLYVFIQHTICCMLLTFLSLSLTLSLPLYLLVSSRSAPPSPTHHTFMPEISLKDIETKLPIPTPPTSTHFSLPQFFPQLAGASNSSHSVPSSPSRPRPPGGFGPTPLKFFPIGGIGRSSSTDDLISAQQKAASLMHKPPMREVITLDDNAPPPIKRVRIMDDQRSPLEGRGSDGVGHSARSMPVPTITSLPSTATPPVQFLSIPLMPPSGLPPGAPPAPPNQTLLTQPLSSFLPQNFFTVASHAHSNQPVRSEAGNGPSVAHSSGGGAGNEG